MLSGFFEPALGGELLEEEGLSPSHWLAEVNVLVLTAFQLVLATITSL